MSKFVNKSLLLVLAFYGFAFAGTYSKTEVRNFNISPTGSIVVENVNGTITVEAWNESQVSLEITKTVRADDSGEAEEYFGKLRVEIQHGDDFLNVYTHYPSDGWKGLWDLLFHGGPRYGNVKYVLKVPATVKLDVRSTNGSIDVHSVTGGVKAGSTNGRLTLDGVNGDIDGSTTNGSITASVAKDGKFKGMNLRTTNGSIKVYCPRDINADLYAHTTNGSIETEFPVTVRGSMSRRSLEGKINDGGYQIYLHTTNGSISINKQ